MLNHKTQPPLYLWCLPVFLRALLFHWLKCLGALAACWEKNVGKMWQDLRLGACLRERWSSSSAETTAHSSWPADTVTPTLNNLREDKINCSTTNRMRSDEACHDVSTADLVFHAHLHPELHVRRSWHSRRAGAGLTALSWHGLSCLLRGWMLSHAVGQGRAQRRKQQHGYGQHVKNPGLCWL